jgi:hypothetical protein
VQRHQAEQIDPWRNTDDVRRSCLNFAAIEKLPVMNAGRWTRDELYKDDR